MNVTLQIAALLPVFVVSAQTPFNSTDIAKKVAPAVVTINAGGQVAGSGFLIGSDGRIVTSLHVIRDLKRDLKNPSVQLAGGDVFDSFTIRAVDERRDLAILQIAGFDLPVIELGNSNDAQTGEPVLLIGRGASAVGASVAGKISDIRELPEGLRVIQTDVSADPGSSGGVLVNARGQAIGVLGFKSMNLAVPINYARGMLNNLQTSVGLPPKTPDPAPKPVVLVAKTPVAKTPVAKTPVARTPPAAGLLKGIQTMAVAPLGESDAANLVRTRLLNRLKSGKLTIVEKPEGADATLKGVVVADTSGIANSASYQLVDRQGAVLWTGDVKANWLGSASESIADRIADAVLKAIR